MKGFIRQLTLMIAILPSLIDYICSSAVRHTPMNLTALSKALRYEIHEPEKLNAMGKILKMAENGRTLEAPLPCPSLREFRIPARHDVCDCLKLQSLVTGTKRVARHESLYRKHDRMIMLYVVRYGQFKLIDGDLNAQRVAGFYMPGDMVGLDAISTGKHHFRLMALENSEVCEIHFAALAETMNVEPAIQRQFLQTMGDALNNEYSQSRSLATMSLDQRFANFLLKLGERYRRLGYSENSYRMSMSRGDIGSYIGTTSESVSRLIARFNASGATSIRGREVELIDRPYLQALACGDTLQ